MTRYLAARQFGRTLQLSFWAWLLWVLPIYLLLEAVPFLIIGLGFKKTASDLVGPFLAFAAPAVIVMSLVWWLRIWEVEGTPSLVLARRWGLSVAILCIGIAFAVCYSGVKLRLMDVGGAEITFAVCAFIGGATTYFVIYNTALGFISSRTPAKPGSDRPPDAG